jgi:hypothetical protein
VGRVERGGSRHLLIAHPLATSAVGELIWDQW